MADMFNPTATPFPPTRPGILPPIIAVDVPIVYEDEGQEQMGDTLPHYSSEATIYFGIMAHLEKKRRQLQALPNMNLYYHRIDRGAYVSPDVMVVEPKERLPDSQRVYRIGEHGAAPILTVEVLSRRTFQQGDMTIKPVIYADLGVLEYIQVDVTGEFLPERLRLQRLDPDKLWTNEQDFDGGVTSALGFRIVIEEDGKVRVVDAQTGERYARPDEAQTHADAQRKAEEARRVAEEARHVVEEALNASEEARHVVEEALNASEEARREEAEVRREEERRRQLAEQSEREALEARREAEESRREIEEAWRRALERTRELDAEIARLKNARPDRKDQ